MTERLSIEQIRTDGGTQTRSGMNVSTISDYAEEMRNGIDFPPVVVFHDGTNFWLADGFHRLSATAMTGQDKIEADVRQGTRRDAVLFSAGANATHGLRRTNNDKHRAVEMLLRDDEWRQWSNREIGRRCAVDEKTVRQVRQELEGTAEIPQSDVRKTADGREMNTSGIGQRPAAQIGDDELLPFDHFDRARVNALSVLSFIDRYKALEKIAPEGAVTVVLTREAAIAFRESAKRAAHALRADARLVDTEHGVALFWARLQATSGGQLYDLSEAVPVRVYNDFSQAASDFYLHHQRRLAEAKRQAEAPKKLVTTTKSPTDGNQLQVPFAEAPKFKVGAQVVLRSGHIGEIVDDWPTVRTVNRTMHYRADYLTPDSRAPEEILMMGDGHVMTPDEQADYEQGAGWQPNAAANRQLESYESGAIVAIVPSLRRVLDFLEGEDAGVSMALKEDVWACFRFFDSATEVIEGELKQRAHMGLLADTSKISEG